MMFSAIILCSCVVCLLLSHVNCQQDLYKPNVHSGYQEPYGRRQHDSYHVDEPTYHATTAPTYPSYGEKPAAYDHHPAPSYHAPEPKSYQQDTHDTYMKPAHYGEPTGSAYGTDTKPHKPHSGRGGYHQMEETSYHSAPMHNVDHGGYDSPMSHQSGYQSKPSGYNSDHSRSQSHQSGYGKSKPSGYNSHLKGFSGMIHSYAPSFTYGNSFKQDDHDCFRSYKNCMIDNAQPYERRSGITLEDCKELCLADSGIDHFICQSFVYDHKHSVCDLFAHTGSQYPAKLAQYYGKDYFEKRSFKCEKSTTTTMSTTVATATVPTTTATITSSAMSDMVISCQPGQIPRYSQINNMILDGFDNIPLGSISLEACIQQCTNTASCRSFDYRGGRCVLANEAAIPTGTGQLQTGVNDGMYFEKLCIQEAVIDSNTVAECYEACVNAVGNFGFTCLSAMYYYEEPENNCILIRDNRNTQPDLFLVEDTEKVDYFEPNCVNSQFQLSRSRSISTRTRFRDRFLAALGVLSSVHSEPTSNTSRDIRVPVGNHQISTGWMEWSQCDRPINGRRFRFQMCPASQFNDCPMETEWCNADKLGVLKEHQSSRSANNTFQFLKSHAVNCPKDECCPFAGNCRIGIELSSADDSVFWCTNPCK